MRFNILLSFWLIFACNTSAVLGQAQTFNFPEFTEGVSIKPYLELSDAYDKNDSTHVQTLQAFPYLLH
jgi:hypothetical protein